MAATQHKTVRKEAIAAFTEKGIAPDSEPANSSCGPGTNLNALMCLSSPEYGSGAGAAGSAARA